MAAEIPVQDVLCEAMEYLSKLGSNLRTRSDSLKEKKIRKDKLTNSLAVQKAAEKVLLICELSKKSLANVEAGVRKILEHIDVFQVSSSIGGKSLKPNEKDRKRADKSRYYYFDYKSRKLKIKNKISLKHYKSVKVLVKRMSKSMLDKYPVYHDCKLYKTRNKKTATESAMSNKINIIEDSDSQDDYISSSRKKAMEKNITDIKEISKNEVNDKTVKELETKETKLDDKENNKINKDRKTEKNMPTKKKVNVIEDSDSQEDDCTGNKNLDIHLKVTNSETPVHKESIVNDKTIKEPKAKKRKLDLDENNQTKDDVQTLDSDSENLNPSKLKDDEQKKPMIKCVSLSKLLKPDLTKLASKNENPVVSKTFDVLKKNEMLATAKKNKEIYLTIKRKEVSEFKPKKIVINITRLPDLKTDFLKKYKLQRITKAGETVSEITKDNLEKATSERSIEKNLNPNSVDSALSNDNNDEKLKSEANKVKKSLLSESNSDNDIDKDEKDMDITVDRIKNALLNSDSDQNDDVSINSPKKNQKPDKDNDKNSENISHTLFSKKVNNQKEKDKGDSVQKDTLESDNKSDKSENSKTLDTDEMHQVLTNENQETAETSSNEIQETSNKVSSNNDDIAKNYLLNYSSDDISEIPLDQRKNTTPQSERKKRIRESVQAKNALLRYSSGSETEDELLRNTLNDIQKSLMEAISDNENKKKDMEPDKEQKTSESSSDENVLKKVKKKKSHIKKRKIRLDSEDGTDHSSDNEDKPSTSRKMVRSKAKPGNSSSHNSDAQDMIDKDIDGLANLRTLNKTRRRSSDVDESESSNSTVTRPRMGGKPTGLISEEILKAESSSEAHSNDEDDAIDEDLPSVTVPGFNGGLQHLVKEDLLVDSDSSASNKDEVKEESDEERLNAKRRKANAISSDSEAGNAGKKLKDDDVDVKLSDFEDSDDSEIAKRAKRKKKGSESDASGGSSDAGKKKRRRIKPVNESDVSGSDSENEGKNKHGRKNIRKVMGKNQLEEATKKAAREEKERVARIAERQKIYNNLQFDESGKPDEVVLDKVVLDFDPETKEPLIAVDRGLVKKLKPHQANGIKFMWDACFESAKRIRKDKGSGCILAHCMGLGKTLQVVALTHTLIAHDSLTKVHRVLVVCPLSTVLNWVNEFKMWLKHAERESDIDVYELSRFKQNSERAFQLSQWFEHGGVCVLGYEMFRNLSADNNKKFKKKMLKNFQEALVDPGPDLVVCDEGHLLKNEKTSLSQSMNKVKTLRRIVLTGTPLQNNLKEYYCMVQFVKPNLLGKYNEYLNRFVNPITNGQYTDSTEHDIKIMKRRSHVLHKMLDGAVQRRDYGVLAPFLPPKHEYVLFITLTEVQTKLYQFYLDNYSRRPLPGKSSGFLFPDFQSLQRIWTHPLVLKYNSERYEIMQQKKRDKEEEDSEGSLVDFIDDDSTPDESSSVESSDDSSELSDDSRRKSKKKKSSKKSKSKDKDKESAAASRRRGTRANPIDLDHEDNDDDIVEVKNENPTEWWIKMVDEDVLEDMRNSHKLILLFDILRQCETIGDKLLVFSQSLYSLDLIEHFLGKVDEATQEGRIDEKLGGHVGSWSPGIDYFRLDGSTSCENRSIWCKNFNREDNPRARLFLISTRAGGLGINLVAANRVVIFDVSWNPSHDVQSIFRVYRFGQKKPCYVYRFLAMGTMEEKIYERQVTKQAISKRVIDEQQIDRHYAENDLAELYKFEAEPPTPRPIPPLPKDRLFAEMLREHEAQIYKYHEHDSLLENKEEETLSEEERKAAWEDFENEKNRPPPAPFPSPWPMHNGMVPNLLAQQQQQLAYAALAAMLRKDMPNVNDNQIRDMLPMIYNANPGLMQKMTDIYKYSQQMNMAPGMMGQGASGGAGMAGMGGASGLQYEPPWQRQQQQQQQLRLQQLMAQQQSMGAASKYYAGGLGSRDPVAMALQQQRAREIMVGGGAGRPRGRPPLQPRAPPPQADVVNLDSD